MSFKIFWKIIKCSFELEFATFKLLYHHSFGMKSVKVSDCSIRWARVKVQDFLLEPVTLNDVCRDCVAP
jgi:hypothetical protein